MVAYVLLSILRLTQRQEMDLNPTNPLVVKVLDMSVDILDNDEIDFDILDLEMANDIVVDCIKVRT